MYGSAGDGKGSAVEWHEDRPTGQGRRYRRLTWQVAYTHALSKRTKLFTGYVKVNNDSTRATIRSAATATP